MSHREKVAWLSLVALTIAYGPYFVLATLEPPSGGGMPDLGRLIRFAMAAGAHMAILAGGHLVLRLREPAEARAPADERDRAIELRSVRFGYYVLIVGTILAGVVLPFVGSGWEIVNAALAAIVLAEIVTYGVTVRSYRRGWSE